MIRRAVFVLVTTSALSLMVAASRDSPQARTRELLGQLQTAETSDRAAEELLGLGKSNPDVRKMMAASLPQAIAKGPKDGNVWLNSVKLAGALKINEAVPGLVKWIDFAGSDFTFSPGVKPDQYPAAWALGEMGDVAVPPLVRVLEEPDRPHRGAPDSRKAMAIYCLQRIKTPAATKALAAALPRQKDARIMQAIKQSLIMMPETKPQPSGVSP